MSWYTCSDCDYMDLKDKNRYGEAYCSKRHHYYKISDTACNLSSIKGRNVGSPSACYLTTAVSYILGYDDHSCYLDDLRNIRDNYMSNEVDCYDLLTEYEELGPEICNSLYNDPNKEQISWIMLNHYIKPAIEAYENDPDKAIDIYIDMTNNLIEKYHIKRCESKYDRFARQLKKGE